LMLKRHALEKAVATASDLIDPATVVSPWRQTGIEIQTNFL
jgi:hypothetical protein